MIVRYGSLLDVDRKLECKFKVPVVDVMRTLGTPSFTVGDEERIQVMWMGLSDIMNSKPGQHGHCDGATAALSHLLRILCDNVCLVNLILDQL